MNLGSATFPRALEKFCTEMDFNALDVGCLAYSITLASQGERVPEDVHPRQRSVLMRMIDHLFFPEEKVIAPEKLLTGKEIAELTGLEYGPKVRFLLSRLQDQQIEAADRHAAGMREVPSRPADHATGGGVREEAGVLGGGEGGPPAARRGVGLLRDHRAVEPRVDHGIQHVLHHRVRLGDHTDPPSVFGDERRDDPPPGVRLAGTRRPLHREVRVVEIDERGGDGGRRVAPRDRRQSGSAAQPRRNPAQDVRCRVRG